MYISFNCDKNLFFILLFLFSSIIFLSIAPYYFSNRYNKPLISISQLFLIIFYLVEKKLSKTVKIRYSRLSEKTKKEQTYKKYLIFFTPVIFYLISSYISIFKKTQNLIERRIFQVFFFLIIDILFFKKQRYAHQIFSTIPFIIYKFIYFVKGFNLQLLFVFLSNYSYAFSFLLVKYINTKYFINVYIFSFIFGLIEFILLLIKGIPFQFFFTDLLYIIYFIGVTVNSYLFYYILNKLSPTHSIIFQYIGLSISMDFIEYFSNIEQIIISIIFIIFSFIYLEIIELNFCNLNSNLKKNIMKREENKDYIIVDNSIASDTDDLEEIF